MSLNKITNQDIFSRMEEWAPKHLAYKWDPVGLQVGSYHAVPENVLVSLDVTEKVVDEAIAKNADLIIVHHPLLFKSLQSLDLNSQKGRIISKLIKHDITVYAAHTNLDIAENGVNDLLAEQIGLKNTKPLIKEYDEKLLKLAVYVPEDHVEKVREALGQAGAGYIGEYSHCTFSSSGTGAFKPLEGTKPFIGNKNEMTFVKEVKLETIIKQKDTDIILGEMFRVHPYEEAAYDLYPVTQTGQSYGLGRIGYLETEMTLAELCDHVKHSYQLNDLRYAGNDSQKVTKVAVLGGSGEKYAEAALKTGADAFITGDVTFHHAQDAVESGLSIIDPGHYIEEIMIGATRDFLAESFSEIKIIASETNTNPFKFK